MTITAEQAEYLKAHAQCVLATGRRDGSPQVSTMIYVFDGEYLTISTTTDRAKWSNVGRQPSVAVLVNDGRRQLIVYGEAERIGLDHPDRITIWRHHRQLQSELPDDLWAGSRPPAPPESDQEYAAQLVETKRVLLRITPRTVLMNE